MYLLYMGVNPKIGGTHQIIHLFIGFGTIINHPFWGGFPPIFGNTHILNMVIFQLVTLVFGGVMPELQQSLQESLNLIVIL